jgi:hypothetical protein
MDAALAALQERALPELASLMDELASWAERLQHSGETVCHGRGVAESCLFHDFLSATHDIAP